MYQASDAIGESLTFPALFTWAATLAKSPRAFFKSMAKSGGYLTPVLTLAFWSFASSVVSFLVGFVRPSAAAGPVGLRLAGVIISPLIGLLVGFILSAVLFVVWHLMGSRENFQAAFRVWSFISPVWAVGALLGVVPYLSVLNLVAAFLLVILASEEVHGLPKARSWTTWSLIAAGVVLLGFVGFLFQQATRGAAPNYFPPRPAVRR